MNKVYGIFGIISGFIEIGLMHYYYINELFMKREYNLLYRSLTVLILAMSVVFAIIAVKKINGNVISFMRSMFTGFMVSLINGLTKWLLFTCIYFFNADLLVKPEKFAKEEFIKNMATNKNPDINVSEGLQNLHNLFTPGGFLMPNMFSSFVFGMITAIFVTAFVYNRSEQVS